MAIFALVVVVLFAALAALNFYSYRLLSKRISALTIAPSPYRYAAPSDQMDLFSAELPSTDIVGAWAAEQEAKGIQISDEEIEIQRQMWAREG